MLVTKDIGPVDAVKESAMIFKRTWGEQVAGNFGLSWAMFFSFVAWTIISVGLFVAGGAIGPVVVIPVLFNVVTKKQNHKKVKS